MILRHGSTGPAVDALQGDLARHGIGLTAVMAIIRWEPRIRITAILAAMAILSGCAYMSPSASPIA